MDRDVTDEEQTPINESLTKQVLTWGCAIVFFLICLYVGLLSLRKPWIEPGPPVRLAPWRPDLRAVDVKPGSAFDLLCRAGDLNGTYISPLANWLHPVRNKAHEEILRDVPAEVIRILDDCACSLDLARKAIAAPNPQMPTPTAISTLKPYLSSTRALARVFAASAIRHAENGDLTRGCEDLIAGMQIGQIVSRGEGIINGLTDGACTLLCCEKLWRIAMAYDIPRGAAETTMQSLQKLDEGSEPLSEAFRYETKVEIHRVDGFMAGDPSILASFPLPPYTVSAVGLVAPLVGSSRNTIRRNLTHCFAHLISMSDGAYTPGAYSARFKVLSSGGSVLLTHKDPIGLMAATMLVSASKYPHEKYLLRTTALRAMRLFLALRQFEQRRGAPPAALANLVPDFLDAVPLDPFDRKPFRYIVLPEANVWCIYSVGPDLIDDKGTARRWCSTHKCKDVVVPSKLYPGKPTERRLADFKTMFSVPPEPSPTPSEGVAPPQDGP